MNPRIIPPNLFTATNLFCGLLGIVCCFSQNIEFAAILILIAAGLDFLDGFVARLFKGQSEFGGQFDSLADMVTFGALPGIIIFQMIQAAEGEIFDPWYTKTTGTLVLSSIGLIVTIASAIRLANFNLGGQDTGFKGIPTPASAIFISGLIFGTTEKSINIYYPYAAEQLSSFAKVLHMNHWQVDYIQLIGNSTFWITVSLLLSFFMLAPIPMIAFKFKSMKPKDNLDKIVLVAVVLILGLLALWPYLLNYPDSWPYIDYHLIWLSIVSYVLVSIGFAFSKRSS